MFRSVIAVVFQSVFHVEMHKNNVFFIFLIQRIKTIQNIQKKLICLGV